MRIRSCPADARDDLPYRQCTTRVAVATIVIERIFGPRVCVAECYGDALTASLFSSELRTLGQVGPRRLAEFRTGRACARSALSRLGATTGPIDRQRDGSPCWPPGVVGAITHCNGYRAAAVAHGSHITHVGLDAELAVPLPAGLLRRIASEDEARQLDTLPRGDDVAWDRLLFSAKEAVYKACTDLHLSSLDYSDRVVMIHADGSFDGFVRGFEGEESFRRLTGRWVIEDGYLGTGIAVARS